MEPSRLPDGEGLFEGVRHVAAVTVKPAADGFHTYRLELAEDGEVGEAVSEIVRSQGWPLRELKRDDKSLEQVFRELTETVQEEAA